jgi:hypothetical protein
MCENNFGLHPEVIHNLILSGNNLAGQRHPDSMAKILLHGQKEAEKSTL